jgi:NAD-dependent SIR2 family protein deacetylase
MNPESVERAAQAIVSAQSLAIGAGAGIGVDSGLPDFRGAEGFWKAYPPFERLGLRFEEVADPRWFLSDPHLAWGFYGHRLNLYRATVPHEGFGILRAWAGALPGGAHVFTSNVDGQFQKAGFEDASVFEVHGSIHHLQCWRRCTPDTWSAAETSVEVDEETMRARDPLPLCPHCGGLARPAILMFDDSQWNEARSEGQSERFQDWLGDLVSSETLSGQSFERLVVVELGAGTSIPSVRRLSEALQRQGATLIRINPREAFGPEGTISLEGGALEALRAIDDQE